jgi:hypothetical protein
MSDYTPNSRVKCPHCLTVVKLEQAEGEFFNRESEHGQNVSMWELYNKGGKLYIEVSSCPDCLGKIITLSKYDASQLEEQRLLWPISSTMPPAPVQVPGNIAQDYNEAAIVLPFSAKASGALSRRCLQSVLKDAGGTKSNNLFNQIDEVLPHLPTYIAENLDAVRQIGNFAAHEQKSQIPGSILDVEPGEAEWNLKVLEALFDFYYVRPHLEKIKRDELNKKLQEAGKPPLKVP